jgi:hypothetical protein
VSHVADLFSGFLAHRKVDGDFENNAIVDALAGGLADAFERLGLIAFGDDEAGIDGARVLRDPRVAPLWALAHAALYVGAKMPGRMAGESDDDYLARARDAVAYPLGIRRGTHEAVRRAIAPLLTGTKTIIIEDSFGGPYDLYVRTQTAETPDPAQVQRLLEGDFVSGGQQGAIRAELKLSYVTADYPAWPEGERTWSAVANGVTWSNVTRGDVT